MKSILFAALLLSSVNVFAGQGSLSAVAQSTVQGLFGAAGDVVSSEFKSSTPEEGQVVEVWNVSLTNNAKTGSALYQVVITKNVDGATEGQTVADISVTYLTGN